MSVFLGRDKGQVPAALALTRNHGTKVACFQELMEDEVELLKVEFPFVRYIPMTRLPDGRCMGLATCSHLPVFSVGEYYFAGNASEIANFKEGSPEEVNATKRRPLLVCRVRGEAGSEVDIANFHFPYSKDGRVNEDQLLSAMTLSNLLKETKPHVVCAALVAPKGWAIYKLLIREGLVDQLPEGIQCTLDPHLHKLAEKVRSGEIRVIPDIIFTYLSGFKAEKVRAVEGVADHTPLIASILPIDPD